MKNLQYLTLALAVALLGSTVACQTGAEAQGQSKNPAKKAAAKAVKTAPYVPAKVPTATVKVTDPMEKSFTVSLPKGWRNQAFLSRWNGQPRPVYTALSPDGKTLLFWGDPHAPIYTVPNDTMSENSVVAQFNPTIKYSEFVPASDYFPDYVQRKFGKLPGFKIVSQQDDPEAVRVADERNVRIGVRRLNTATQIRFDYTDNGKPMHAMVKGSTVQQDSGLGFLMWLVDVSGASSPGDPTKYSATLIKTPNSFAILPQWQAKEQATHEARMAQLRQDHANQLANWDAANKSHGVRMQAIQAAGEANTKNFYDRMAQSDITQRNFLNYITDEETVVSSSGKTYQVGTGHQRYFLNKSNNTFIGTNSTTDLEDLRRKMKINPSDYEEVKIKK